MSNNEIDLRTAISQAGEHVRAEDSSPDVKRPIPKPRTSQRFDQLARIEGRLTAKQLADLTSLRLKLIDPKNTTSGPRERITNNTLLRVAVTVLLEHKNAVNGGTEKEITQSLLAHLDGRSARQGNTDAGTP